MEKQCRKCGATKPPSEFYYNRVSKCFAPDCKECALARMKARYVAKPPKARPPEGIKKCSRCKELKPVGEFGVHSKTPDGLQYYCRPCQTKSVMDSYHKNPEAHRRGARLWREKNQQRHYDNGVRKRIGKHVTHGTYAALFERQDGKCAICGTRDPGNVRTKRLHLDHCHVSQQVRGLLCHNCNRLLGAARDNVATLDAAKSYLLRDHDK